MMGMVCNAMVIELLLCIRFRAIQDLGQRLQGASEELIDETKLTCR